MVGLLRIWGCRIKHRIHDFSDGVLVMFALFVIQPLRAMATNTNYPRSTRFIPPTRVSNDEHCLPRSSWTKLLHSTHFTRVMDTL